MSTVVTCTCGAKVRLPEETSQRSFRCPKCKAAFARTADARIIAPFEIASGSAPSLCPICQSPIAAGETAISCPNCSQVHHHECWVEVGGCSTYGCAQAPATQEASSQQPLTAWGDTKICPICGEKIKSIALKCRYCQAEFNSADPLTLADLKRQDRKAAAQRSKQGVVIVLFVVTLLGCTAPIMVVVNPIWVFANRKELAAAGPFYLILGYSATALAVLYSVLMLLFYPFG